MSDGDPRKLMLRGLWEENAIFRQVLGICSTLAVTNLVLNTAVMCTALTLSTALSCLTVSLLRHLTPRGIRMMVETLIIAFYVILVDMWLKAYWPGMSRQLGPYVGLIITNCIIMGRCEAYANSNPPVPAFLDGLANGLGYSFVLLIVATIRETMGMGSWMGIPLPVISSEAFTPYRWIIMITPPGAFFALTAVIWFFRSIGAMKGEEAA